ncbi:MAG: DNA-protecting protein DprA [Clostridia bacterium]|nr:DNA-protecting protein DprA [Clostridia bacterium]
MTETIDKNRIQAVPLGSPLYPKEWTELKDAPPVVYAYGDLSLLAQRKLVIVGSRRTPANALKLGSSIAKELSESMTIITGTADGGDSAAIEGGLNGSGKVVCVLAGGFAALPQGNLALLKQVAQKGLLLSPYEYDTPVRTFSYGYRNKLLAALGEAVLVLGAGEKSGALVTADYAFRYKKPVFALPYPPASASGAGCNALIKRGGYLTEAAQDVAQKLGLALCQRRTSVELTAEEARTLAALKENPDGHISEIAREAGLSPFKAMAVLSALEVKGLAVALGGNRYAPV